MPYEMILGAFQQRAGIEDRGQAEQILAAVVELLGERLAQRDAETVADGLPPPLRELLRQARPHADPGVERLFAHVGARAGVTASFAREHAATACQALAQALDEEHLRLLQARLPPAWWALFEPRSEEEEGEPERLPGTGHTLATGRPGSTHPLSEARPAAGQSDSVITAANPHATSKISSATGPHLGREIAGSRPGGDDPLSEARDPRRKP